MKLNDAPGVPASSERQATVGEFFGLAPYPDRKTVAQIQATEKQNPPSGVPVADEAREREAFEAAFREPPLGVAWNGSTYVFPKDWAPTVAADRFINQWEGWKARACVGVECAGGCVRAGADQSKGGA